ncbi:hypothetical protein [Chondrinema litorale]|uniref:hypothetical protein n=1 Tax=Chondrinema litorale TaxID=2994555 RepID=UPI002542C6F0|nr:hypothetical protein [Chondrinema litorale]UZR93136.1 hypothetical protein OQ292_14850 [Chondrinema litorale]
MAKSPSHKFGQIIGEILETTMKIYFQDFATKFDLYLDKKGKRKARKGKKVTWYDSYENKHDLDFVLERGGSDAEIGLPVAFIEIAWRRYTKHSRNKAQEIQGAILPLAFTHSFSAPFLGVVLAGVFTEGALNQLRSRNFNVLYFEYDTVVSAFKTYGIDASYEEDTSDEDFTKKIEQWEAFNDKEKIIQKLVELNQDKFDIFFKVLEESVSRYITEIRILPLLGTSSVFQSATEAINFLNEFTVIDYETKDLIRFEIKIIYSNGDTIEASFANKNSANSFLKAYEIPDLNVN